MFLKDNGAKESYQPLLLEADTAKSKLSQSLLMSEGGIT